MTFDEALEQLPPAVQSEVFAIVDKAGTTDADFAILKAAGEICATLRNRSQERPMLTEKAMKDIEEGFGLQRRAWQILDLVVAEWLSDPMSVQCFDLRIVEEAKQLVARRKILDKRDPMGGVFE